MHSVSNDKDIFMTMLAVLAKKLHQYDCNELCMFSKLYY